MKRAALFVAIFVFGFMCGIAAFGMFAMAMSDPLTPPLKKPTSYQSACYRSMT